MRHTPLLIAGLLAAVAAGGAIAAGGEQTLPAECTIVPGSSGYMRCVYSEVRAITAEAPARRRTLTELRRSQAADKVQASGAAAAIDMVRTIGVAQGAR